MNHEEHSDSMMNSTLHSLSRKRKGLNQEVLMEIFTNLVQKVSNRKPSSKTTSLQLIDSTTIPLNKTWYPWAKFRQTKAGIKLHLNLCFLDKNNQYPESFTITNAIEPDRNQFEVVTPKTRDGQLISDQQVILGGGINHVTERFRLVTVLTTGQKLLRLVTNRFDVSPNEVADMYQAHWFIELFFKHLKQNVTIKHLYSQSEQGAINQVILTLIATLLTYLVKVELNVTTTLFKLKRSFHYLMFEPVEKWFKWLQSD